MGDELVKPMHPGGASCKDVDASVHHWRQRAEAAEHALAALIIRIETMLPDKPGSGYLPQQKKEEQK